MMTDKQTERGRQIDRVSGRQIVRKTCRKTKSQVNRPARMLFKYSEPSSFLPVIYNPHGDPECQRDSEGHLI
jgi:hypothetical protein